MSQEKNKYWGGLWKTLAADPAVGENLDWRFDLEKGEQTAQACAKA
jgi:hypothetical protein